MALTFPYTLANGNTSDATQVMANFDAIKTYVDTTKLSAQSNLSTPYALVPVTFSIDGDLAGGTTVNRYFKVPTGVTLIPLSAQVAFDVVTAGTPTVELQLYVGATPALTAACTTSTADTINEKLAFDTQSFAPATTIKFAISNTAAGGNTANGVTATCVLKAYLQS